MNVNAIRNVLTTLVALGIVALLGAGSAAWAQTEAVDTEVVTGEVVRIENQGETTQLHVRTRRGETLVIDGWRAGECVDCVRAGDRIRARVEKSGAADAPGTATQGEAVMAKKQMRSMKVQRTGETIEKNAQSGTVTRSQTRLRDGSGDGTPDRQRLRTHEPGTGGGTGTGSRGSRGGGGGGGRR